MNDFGKRLKEAMERQKMNASELSRISGVGKNLISYYINGKCIAKQDKVYLLAKALNADPGWLMTGFGPEEDQEEPYGEPATEEARILAKGIDQLPPAQREQALAVVRAMFAQHPELFDK